MIGNEGSAERFCLQTFELAPSISHRLQLQAVDLALHEHIVELGLEYHAYPSRTKPHLDCQTISLGMAKHIQMLLAFIRLSIEVKASALDR